ncbi:hypothetical protein [Geomicrobium sp. JCM 19055]|uniref:hypothetical protein n=1 Tax=Geomicrobium sp. JCM 19055 TaxID=1460649 RepID=UPI0005A8737E|nr:hypothetical protein [Geomicrobium sp. JCM 19055]
MQRTYADTVRHGRYSGYVEYPYRQAYSQRPDRHQGHHVLMEKMNDFFGPFLPFLAGLAVGPLFFGGFGGGMESTDHQDLLGHRDPQDHRDIFMGDRITVLIMVRISDQTTVRALDRASARILDRTLVHTDDQDRNGNLLPQMNLFICGFCH